MSMGSLSSTSVMKREVLRSATLSKFAAKMMLKVLFILVFVTMR